MYFLLFGVPPFYSEKEDQEECEDEIFESVIAGHVGFHADRAISDMAKDLILRLLEKEPSKRITADEVLLHPWIKNHSLPNQEGKAVMKEKRNLLKTSINRVIDCHSKVSDL